MRPTALHALTAIRAATGASRCKPCTCDVDSSGTITPTDALRILQRAVGLNISLACPATCNPLCGDRIVDTPIEECDDGTSTSSCDANCTLAVCGDGFRNEAAGEQCDRGRADAICDADCTAAVCGDGWFNPAAGEQCDDGRESSACNEDCTLAWCGDGKVNRSAGERCDDISESQRCDLDCTSTVCGDGHINPVAGEECDDGNYHDGDGCSSGCMLSETCGDGIPGGGEECDDGNLTAGDGCDPECRRETCENTGTGVACLYCPPAMQPDAAFAACECDDGYALVDGICADIDECSLGTHGCGAESPCVNLPGSWSCSIECSEMAFEQALATCGAPSGTITFDCADTTIALSNQRGDDGRIVRCDGLRIDGLDRNIEFALDPVCNAIPILPHRCAVALNSDGTCDCPDINNGTGFLVLLGSDNRVENLTVRGFFEGIKLGGRNNLVRNVEFDRLCDDAIGTLSGGAGNVFSDLVIRRGCDKCMQSFGDLADTDPDPRLDSHYNGIFRNIDFIGCAQPARMTDAGRYRIERSRLLPLPLATPWSTPDRLFECSGPRFSSGLPGELIVHIADTEMSGCRRGIRIGGQAAAVLTRNRISNAMLRGVLATGESRARLESNVIVGNGGEYSAEAGEGGVSVLDSAHVDLGGGAVTIDGETLSSRGLNVICANVDRALAPRQLENRSTNPVSALHNYWCGRETEPAGPGLSSVDPDLPALPTPP